MGINKARNYGFALGIQLFGSIIFLCNFFGITYSNKLSILDSKAVRFGKIGIYGVDICVGDNQVHLFLSSTRKY